MRVRNLFIPVLISVSCHAAFAQDVLKIDIKGPNAIDIAVSYKDKPVINKLTLPKTFDIVVTGAEGKPVRLEFVNKRRLFNTFIIQDNLTAPLKVVDGLINGSQLANVFSMQVFNGDVKMAPVNCIFEGTELAGAAAAAGPVAPGPVVPDEAAVGSMLNDAWVLTNNFASPEAQKVLAYYAQVTTPAEIKAAYAGNKHLTASVSLLAPDKQSFSSLIGAALGKAGGLDVTSAAFGLTDFIIKRGKEELNIEFFSKFKTFISDDKYIDFRTMFPSTYNTFQLVGEDIYNYNRYLQSLQAAFKRDLAQLPDNFPSIIDNHAFFFAAHPKLKASLLSGFYISESLRNGNHPGDVIEQYNAALLDSFELDPAGIPNPNIGNATRSIQLLSFSLRDRTNAAGNYWVDPALLRKTFLHPVAREMFLGLLYQWGRTKYTKLEFVAGTDRFDVLTKINDLAEHRDEINSWEAYLTTLVGKTKELEEMVKEYKGRARDSLKVEQLYQYFTSSVDVLKFATRITDLPGFKGPDLARLTSVYFEVANTSASLIANANRKQYISALTDAVTIYSLVRNRDHAQVLADLDKALKNAATESEKINISMQLKRENGVADMTTNLFRYGTFMAAIADAHSPEEVSAAIEVFALPSGSARIKRESPFNISLNAYIGPFVGYEKISGLKKDDDFSLNSFGIAAPVGVAVSWGDRKFFYQGKGHWSYSVFVSLIDLGTLATFRLGNSTVEEVPTIQLKDIVSPGVFFSTGIPKSPISVNVGAQIGPNLRKIKDGANDHADGTYLRYSASVLVDIPLLNFYTRTK